MSETDAKEPPLSPDPLEMAVRLPLRTVCYPLGFAVEIATNHSGVLQAVKESWGEFRQRFDDPPARVNVIVAETGAAAFPASPVYRAQQHLLAIVSDPDNFAMSDLARGFGFCRLSPSVVEKRAWMRYHFLEGMIYPILTHQHLTPIHAACVVKDGRGLLLSGPSGSGKTTLAYACARRGWTFVTDDVSFLVRNRPDLVVLGKPHELRFVETAAELFPELADRSPTVDVRGQRLIEVRTATLAGVTTAVECLIDSVVFLRRPAAVFLRSMDRDAAYLRLLAETPRLESSVHEAHQASLRRLLAAGAWEIGYRDLDEAVDALETLVRQGSATCG